MFEKIFYRPDIKLGIEMVPGVDPTLLQRILIFNFPSSIYRRGNNDDPLEIDLTNPDINVRQRTVRDNVRNHKLGKIALPLKLLAMEPGHVLSLGESTVIVTGLNEGDSIDRYNDFATKVNDVLHPVAYFTKGSAFISPERHTV